jgi:hypothetical protein
MDEIVDLSTNAGQQWLFQPGNAGGKWSPLRVPEGGWRAQGLDCDEGIYRTEIAVPSSAEGRTVLAHFEAVNFGAEVFAGTDLKSLKFVSSHVCGWMPFDADITAFARPGDRCHLAVRVRGRKKYLRNDKYLVPQGATWFDGLADGIIRGVSLRILPRVRIEDVFVRTSVEEDSIRIEPVVVNDSKEDRTFTIRASVRSTNGDRFRYPEFQPATFTVGPGERQRLDMGQTGWGLGRESFWWPNVPYRPGYRTCLHELTLALSSGEETLHVRSQRFGFREFGAKGNRYFLNGVPCNLRGDNQQEANFGTDAYGTFPGFGPATAETRGWPGAVDNLLRLNFNVMRIHQIPATPYMLDVCDEMGLMIVSETPVRGSEGKEDFVAGRENMVAAARELALRDHGHPSVVIYSAANEIWKQRGLALALTSAMLAVDDTRPVIIDGTEDLGAPLVNMEHYVGGLGLLPELGASPRSDRPYGETESVWPMDNSYQGFAWMATATRIRRIKKNADIRNYVLNNAWPNYVPGQSRDLQLLEKKIKDIRWEQVTSGMEICPDIADPWTHPLIRLMQKSFHPVAVFDIEYDELNKRSDETGTWPVVRPELRTGARTERHLVVFNDEFSDPAVHVEWETRIGGAAGEIFQLGTFTLHVPLGEYRHKYIRFTAPPVPCELVFIVRTMKEDRVELFREDAIAFTVVP